MNRRLMNLALAVSIAMTTAAVTGCSDDGNDGGAAPATGAVDTSPVDTVPMVGSESPIVVTGAWARTSPAMATAGAVYMTIESAVDDALVGAAVDPSVAADAQVHETAMAGGGMPAGSAPMVGSGSTMAAEMTMRQIDRIEIAAGEALALEPGGYHIMLMGLVTPLEIGRTIDVTLIFENAGEVTVTAEVREEAP